MSFRDYGDDSSGIYYSDREYEEIVKKGIKDIKKEYGKEKAEEFRVKEEEMRKMFLEDIANSKEDGHLLTDSVWMGLSYSIFKDSIYTRLALHTRECKTIKNRKS